MAEAAAAMTDSSSTTTSSPWAEAEAAAAFVSDVRTASNCLDSHSCRREVCDGLSHCAKQHGTHNPFG